MPARPGLGPCSIDGCDRDVFARGWCTMHYNRWRRDGDTGPVGPTRTSTPRRGECMVVDCGEPIQARRMCNRHLKRHQVHGDPGPAEPLRSKNLGKDCIIEGCARPAEKREMCSMHYGRWRQYGDPGEAESRYLPAPSDGRCSVDGCDREAKQKRLCGMHDSRLRNKGDVGPPGPLRNPRGHGRYTNLDGYVLVYVKENGQRKGDYVLEHRLVMERVTGRSLLPNENVHHKNGIRDDNRPENLELWVKAQAAGQRVQDLVDWIVETYPEYIRSAIEGRPQLFLP